MPSGMNTRHNLSGLTRRGAHRQTARALLQSSRSPVKADLDGTKQPASSIPVLSALERCVCATSNRPTSIALHQLSQRLSALPDASGGEALPSLPPSISKSWITPLALAGCRGRPPRGGQTPAQLTLRRPASGGRPQPRSGVRLRSNWAATPMDTPRSRHRSVTGCGKLRLTTSYLSR